MPSFSAELDKACARRAKELRLDLRADEIAALEGVLFEAGTLRQEMLRFQRRESAPAVLRFSRAAGQASEASGPR
jgi:hypothetical protein